jgi:hypothetical protein
MQLNSQAGYGLGSSGGWTVYAKAGSGGKNNLVLSGPGVAGTNIASVSAGTPFVNNSDPVPSTLQLSGDRVLYLLNDPDTGFDARIYDASTGQTSNYPKAAAYAISGPYLVWLALDGSVWRQDVVANTAAVQLRAPTTVPSGDQVEIEGQVAAAGDYVAWLVNECLEVLNGFSCIGGNREAGFRNAVTMDPATVVVTTPTVPTVGTTPLTTRGIALSSDYLLVDENNRSNSAGLTGLTAVPLADPESTIVVSTTYATGTGKYAVDGSTVAWIDASGEPKVADLASGVDRPRVLTTAAPATYDEQAAWNLDVVTSAVLDSCSVAITDSAHDPVATLPCDSASLATGGYALRGTAPAAAAPRSRAARTPGPAPRRTRQGRCWPPTEAPRPSPARSW